MKNVLVLDNDLYFANMLKLYFQKLDVVCTICDNGNLAVKYIAENVYDLIICNTQLGHKTGLELTMFLKNQSSDSRTPIILITPNHNASMNSNFEELHANAILHKPVNFQTLMSTIHDIENQRVFANS